MLSDVWNIKPEELQICKRPDGSEWLLGTGSFGQVRSPAGCAAPCDGFYWPHVSSLTSHGGQLHVTLARGDGDRDHGMLHTACCPGTSIYT